MRLLLLGAALAFARVSLGAAQLFEGPLTLAADRGTNFSVRAQSRACAVSFDARITEPSIRPGHFSVRFSGETGEVTVYSSGKGIFYIVKDHDKTQPRVDVLTAKVDFRGERWHGMRFTIGRNRIQLTTDGDIVFTKSVDLGALKTVRLQNYRQPFEAKGLTIEHMAVERDDFVEKPLLSGNWTVKDLQKLDVRNILRNKAGALMFWFTTPTDECGKYGKPLFRFKDADDKDVLSGDLDFSGFSCTFAVPNARPRNYKMHNLAGNWKRAGTRVHFAVTWNDSDVRLFFNGVPYAPYEGYYNPPRDPLFEKLVESAVEMTLFEGEYDDLQLLRRRVSNFDVWRAFRREMPVDVVMREQMVESDRPFVPVVTLAPGGALLEPSPFDTHTTAKGLELVSSLYRPEAKSRPFFVDRRTIDVTDRLDVSLPETSLLPGKYVFEAKVKAIGARRPCSYVAEFIAAPYPKADAPTDEDYVRGPRLFERKLDNSSDKAILRNRDIFSRTLDGVPYLETGAERHERLSFEVSFPRRTFGRPVLLELDWPDNAPRMMGVYLYVPSKGYCDRDRLQQGIQSGREYPLTGKIKTERFIFWPGAEDYLFEVRTLSADMPAAVSALRAYEIYGDLPSLKVHEPNGVPARRFGFYDEDQTWYTNMNQDWYDKVAKTNSLCRDTFFTEAFVRYCAYTGMNAVHLPIVRYSAPLYATPSKTDWMAPAKTGGWRWFARALGVNGISLVPIVNLWGLPELRTATVTDRMDRYRDWLLGDEDGRPVPYRRHGFLYALASNDEALAAYGHYVRETVRELKDETNVSALQLDVEPWNCLECGYDDHTVAQFARETGVAVPGKDRHAFLTSPEIREKWIAWRCRRTTDAVRSIRRTLDEIRPSWTLLWTVRDHGSIPARPRNRFPEDPFWGRNRKMTWQEFLGVDLDALNAIPGVFAFRQNRENQCRWELYMRNNDTAIEDVQTDYRGVADAFRPESGAASYAEIYSTYFENMEMPKTLMPEKYSSFFQDADVKGNGRFWLKPLVFSVATQDALETSIGGQPFGTIGREECAREFARAYRALPAVSFEDVPGAEDPVTVRFLETSEGTYFYLANVSHGEISTRLAWESGVFRTSPMVAENLSTGREEPIDVIDLKPYEFRSFLVRNRRARIVSAASDVDLGTREYFVTTARIIRQALETIKSVKGNALEKETAVIVEMNRALAENRLAEAHRLQQSLYLRRLVSSAARAEEVAEQQREFMRGHIAINCGSTEFFRGADGKLFCPDGVWSEKTGYGYLGISAQAASRDVAALKPTPYKGLYRTERYDVDGYRFRVPAGTYAVTLYLRWGFAPEFKPGELILSAEANGRTALKEFDFYKAADGDMDRPLQVTVEDVLACDGLIELRLRRAGACKRSSVRALVGVEVNRRK